MDKLLKIVRDALDALIESHSDVATCLADRQRLAGIPRYDKQIAFYEEQLVKHDAAIEALKQALAQQEQPYAHRAIPGLTIDPVTGNVGIEAPKQEQPAQGKCKCGHVGTSITVVESFPVHSVSVDEEDPDYKEHYHGLDVDATLQIGLEICRNCKTINGFWIEDTGGAEFYADWGKPRYTHPAPTQPALSDKQILDIFGKVSADGMGHYMTAVGRAIEAHCRGGAAS